MRVPLIRNTLAIGLARHDWQGHLVFQGVGIAEAAIVGVVFLLNFGIPLLSIILAVALSKQAPIDAHSPAPTFDVRSWSSTRVGWLIGLTAFPALPVIALVATVVTPTTWIGESDIPVSGPTDAWFAAVFAAVLIALLVTFGLLIVYIVIAVRSPLTDVSKVLWCVALVLGGWLAYPFILYMLVWRPRQASRELGTQETLPETYG